MVFQIIYTNLANIVHIFLFICLMNNINYYYELYYTSATDIFKGGTKAKYH